MLRTTHRQAKLDFPFATINIILLLLFFFIVTGSIVGKDETRVAPPVTSLLATDRLPRPLLVIDRSGELFLDQVRMSLSQAIAASAADRSGRPLNIVADRSLPAEMFLDIVDQVRSAGVPVRIVTLHAAAGG
jgi:biopolymer transport protein ExbD